MVVGPEVAEQPYWSVEVTVTCPDVEVVKLLPVEPLLQLKLSPPVAVSVSDSPSQILTIPAGVMIGSSGVITFTVIGFDRVEQPKPFATNTE